MRHPTVVVVVVGAGVADRRDMQLLVTESRIQTDFADLQNPTPAKGGGVSGGLVRESR